jgi:D-3-phosphoglycerate dehydrogenase
MPVIAHTRSGSSGEGIEAVSLQKLFERADILALCAPLTADTRGIVDAEALGWMKPGAILVNVARGPLVVESALVKALSDGHLGGAALDVFDTQPLPSGHPYLSLPNVILTPHMAGITEESMLRMGQGVVAETRRVLAGDLPVNLVNPAVVLSYRGRFPV